MRTPSQTRWSKSVAALSLALLFTQASLGRADVDLEASSSSLRPWMFSFSVTGTPTSFTDDMTETMATSGFGDDVPPGCVDLLIIVICSSGRGYPTQGEGERESHFTSLAYTTGRGMLMKLGYEHRQLGAVEGRNEDVGLLSIGGESRSLAAIVGLERSTELGFDESARLYWRAGAGPVAGWSRSEATASRVTTSHSRFAVGALAEGGVTLQINRWLALDVALQSWFVPSHKIPAITVTNGMQSRTFPSTEMTLSHTTTYVGVGTRW